MHFKVTRVNASFFQQQRDTHTHTLKPSAYNLHCDKENERERKTKIKQKTTTQEKAKKYSIANMKKCANQISLYKCEKFYFPLFKLLGT